jgi:hypothetical protein
MLPPGADDPVAEDRRCRRAAFHAQRFEAREQTLQGEPNASSAFGARVSLSTARAR